MVLSVGQLESDDQGKRPSLQSLSIAVGITLCGPHDPLVTPFFGIIFYIIYIYIYIMWPAQSPLDPLLCGLLKLISSTQELSEQNNG